MKTSSGLLIVYLIPLAASAFPFLDFEDPPTELPPYSTFIWGAPGWTDYAWTGDERANHLICKGNTMVVDTDFRPKLPYILVPHEVAGEIVEVPEPIWAPGRMWVGFGVSDVDNTPGAYPPDFNGTLDITATGRLGGHIHSDDGYIQMYHEWNWFEMIIGGGYNPSTGTVINRGVLEGFSEITIKNGSLQVLDAGRIETWDLGVGLYSGNGTLTINAPAGLVDVGFLHLGYHSTGTINLLNGTLDAVTFTTGHRVTNLAGGVGTFNQSGGNAIFGSVDLYSNASTGAEYYLTGGQCQADSFTIAGWAENSRLVQSGGQLNVTGFLTVGGTGGESYDCAGFMESSGGTLNAGSFRIAGSNVTECWLTQQADVDIANDVIVGSEIGTQGDLFLMDQASLTCRDLTVGYDSEVTQAGSATTLSGRSMLVNNGTYHLFDGTANLSGTAMVQGELGTSLLRLSRGEFSANSLYVDSNIDATCLMDGNCDAMFTYVTVGQSGSGTLRLQELDSTLTSDYLDLAVTAGSDGLIDLVNGSVTLASLQVGYGNGTVQQSGGYLTCGNVAARRANGTGAYTITGGTLNADQASGINLHGGFVNTSQLTVASGDTSNGTSVLGSNYLQATTSLDVLHLNLGRTNYPDFPLPSQIQQNLRVRGNFNVGVQCQAAATVAATTQVDGNLKLANGASLTTTTNASIQVNGTTQIGPDESTASLTLNGPLTTTILQLGPNAVLTEASPALAPLSFHQLVSPNNTTNLEWQSAVNLGLANQAQAGELRLDGGTLQTGLLTIGAEGSATMIHGWGNVRANGGLRLGMAGHTGTYQLSGLLFAPTGIVGAQGTGHFQQTSGWAQFSNNLILGEQSGSTGTYTLQFGNVDAPALQVGAAGSGSWLQSGGRVRAMTSLGLGATAGSSGSYEISGMGYLETSTLTIGAAGSGTMDVNLGMGGAVNINQTLGLGTQAGGTGLLTLRAGSVNAPNSTVDVGTAGHGTINFVGGLLGDSSSRTIIADQLNVGAHGAIQSSGFNNVLRINHLNPSGSFNFAGVLEIGHWGGDGGGDVTLTQNHQLNATLVVLGQSADASLKLYDNSTVNTDVLLIGDQGGGDLMQYNGTVTVLDEITLGSGSGNGAYTVSGGTLQAVDAPVIVGRSGTGSLTMMGGSANIHSLQVGKDAAVGNLNIHGGLLGTRSVEFGSNGMVSSSGTTGELRTNALTFAGVSFGLTGTLTIGHAAGGGPGGMVLAPDKDLSAGNLVVGYDTSGTYTQEGGATHATTNLKLGDTAAGVGTFLLSSGSLDGTHAYVGKQGRGELTNNSSHVLAGSLTLGDAAGASGTYRMNGSANLQAGSEYIGNYGSGSFIQSGGTHTGTTFYVANMAASNGEFQLNGGTLTLSGALYAGNRGTAQWTQNGGTCQASSLYLGNIAGSQGTYTMTGGSFTAGSQYIGYNGTGRFMQTGGTNNSPTGYLFVGRSTGNGTYELSGTGVLGVYSEDVGYGGTGTFIQSGGTHTVQGALVIGTGSGKNGTFDLSGGTLSSFGVYIGNSGNGVFQQSGGTITANTVALGSSTTGNGRYETTGGGLNVENLTIGNTGTGTFKILDNSAIIEVGTKLTFGAKGTFTAVPGSTFHMTGTIVENKSIDPGKLGGLNATTMVFEGGAVLTDTFEVAGRDYGANEAGFMLNFALDRLVLGGADVGRVQLVSTTDNQPSWTGREALYVDQLDVPSGSNLDLNGFTVYYHQFTGDMASVSLNGGALIRVMSDYDTWATGFSGFNDTTADADPDRDSQSNQMEYAFGLNPASGSSNNPITAALKPNGMFRYTRREPSLTGLSYTVWVSTDLETWNHDAAAVQSAGPPNAEHVEEVSVTLSAVPPGGRCFVRISAQ